VILAAKKAKKPLESALAQSTGQKFVLCARILSAIAQIYANATLNISADM
jgi:hypothetical protein